MRLMSSFLVVVIIMHMSRTSIPIRQTEGRGRFAPLDT
jgi:hypothetical protein